MRGVVLLEVILAMTLFVSTAAVVLGAMNAAMRQNGDLSLQATALDRAVSIFSDVRVGLIDAVDAGPNPCDAPFDDWTWQLTVAPVTLSRDVNMQRVTVVVANAADHYQLELTELMLLPQADSGQAGGGA